MFSSSIGSTSVSAINAKKPIEKPTNNSKSVFQFRIIVTEKNEKITEDKIKFANFINDYSLRHIGFLDQKSSIIVAINGVLLGLLSGSKNVLVPRDLNYLFGFVVFLLGASAVFGLLTIIPRINAKRKSIVFHETALYEIPFHTLDPSHILDRKHRIPYGVYHDKEWCSVDLNKILDEEIGNTYRLAEALHYQQKRKYNNKLCNCSKRNIYTVCNNSRFSRITNCCRCHHHSITTQQHSYW